MSLFLSILQMVLPVAVTIGLGMLCRAKGIVDSRGIDGVKKVIGNITLPAVLFYAFFTAEYSMSLLLIFAVVFACCAVALGVGFLSRRLVKPYGKFFPLLMTSFECGMLGYALFGLVAGDENLSVFASVDIGQTVFAYTVFLGILMSLGGNKPSPRGLALNMVKTPAFDGMALGIICGAAGLDEALSATAFSGIITDLLEFIKAPTAVLILIVVGYQLSFSRRIIRPVLITAVLRLAVSAVLCVAASVVIFAVIPFDKTLMTALILMFSLPAPFIIPLFADVGGDGEYISTSLSVSTIVTIIAFVGIAMYSGM